MTRLRTRIAAALGMALAVAMLAAAPADARRGGSFGSRGSRTYSAPSSTATSPGYVAPVQRSMTSPSAAPGGAFAPRPGMPGYSGYQPGYGYGGPFGRSPFGGFMGGLVAGGLIGGLLGHGFGGGWGGGGWGGGGGGLLTIVIQLLVLFLIVTLAMRFFRRRSAGYSPFEAPAYDGGPQPFATPGPGFGGGPFGGTGFGGGPAAQPYVPTTGPAWEIPITAQDQATFESLLKEIQDAFGREDYAGLRERCTPEVMSYLSEELSENATHGRRNEVTGTRLLQADVGEAWRENDVEYATAAMRYESIDLMRDRASGAVLSGDPNTPSQTTELWTFARQVGGPWKLSAIQDAKA
ncbi:MAG TPA: TIM44-like domain-containing protein [Phenylobacterium sp.]|jgi:predicted lipid-binding transport protein (Tim44 family)|uniref:Tim44 domain-containing protein n=1 Tax=Phenylobacterium sp. TaxID=1871053 RepID=UPI002B56BB3A|nr:TIM44-like domain-containing protein [Phenylobacterium sp.]HXA41229.1 TIM44-like domain-containing protein [Phenylobacterium sp.]